MCHLHCRCRWLSLRVEAIATPATRTSHELEWEVQSRDAKLDFLQHHEIMLPSVHNRKWNPPITSTVSWKFSHSMNTPHHSFCVDALASLAVQAFAAVSRFQSRKMSHAIPADSVSSAVSIRYLRTVPGALSAVYFVSSGAEICEISRKWWENIAPE